GLKDRVAIVTGASRGIGRASAAELLAEGANVVVASLDPERNAEACRALSGKGGRVLGIRFDIESDDSVRLMVERTLAEFGRLDILVNNAALATSTRSAIQNGAEASTRSSTASPAACATRSRRCARANGAASSTSRVVQAASRSRTRSRPV